MSDAYSKHLPALRAAHHKETRSAFERRWQYERRAELQAEHDALAADAEDTIRALSAKELSAYTPPDRTPCAGAAPRPRRVEGRGERHALKISS